MKVSLRYYRSSYIAATFYYSPLRTSSKVAIIRSMPLFDSSIAPLNLSTSAVSSITFYAFLSFWDDTWVSYSESRVQHSCNYAFYYFNLAISTSFVSIFLVLTVSALIRCILCTSISLSFSLIVAYIAFFSLMKSIFCRSIALSNELIFIFNSLFSLMAAFSFSLLLSLILLNYS